MVVVVVVVKSKQNFVVKQKTHTNTHPHTHTDNTHTHTHTHTNTFLDSFNQPNCNNSLTLLSLNIRSIPLNMQHFTDSDLLMCNDVNLDILRFTETRFEETLVPLHQLPGYNMFAKCRNMYGGGITLYISINYYSTLSDDFSLLNISLECLEIGSKLSVSYLSLCIYRPPSGNINSFLSTIMNILASVIARKFDGLFALGDSNLNLMFFDDKYVHDFLTLMYSSLFPLITRPTRITDTIAALIDHIFLYVCVCVCVYMYIYIYV